ncbi:MAG: hypothetical protein IJ537_04570 [Bacteroidaceae bacterium]|nr:hypothetical protein [Bacteroidaceae bacterium]
MALTDEDGLVKVMADEDALWSVKESKDDNKKIFYDTEGRPNMRPQKGINIIRMSDGTTRKILVK